jgi:hypothetical protein
MPFAIAHPWEIFETAVTFKMFHNLVAVISVKNSLQINLSTFNVFSSSQIIFYIVVLKELKGQL